MYMTDAPKGSKTSSLRDDLLQQVVYGAGQRPQVGAALVEEFELRRQRLLPGVEYVSFRYFDSEDNEWLSQWPPQTTGNAQPARLPDALEITLDTSTQGQVRRLFHLRERRQR